MDFLLSIYKWLSDGLNFILPISLVVVGFFFLFVTKGVQFSLFKVGIKNLLSGDANKSLDDTNISPVQAFMTGLASRVGIGNIAGVASAIVIGGPGAVFWMWFAALLGMASAFAESSLAQLYKTKNAEGQFVGGPAFYIAQGLKLPIIGVVFSICLAFTYGFAFNSIQANQIANTLHANFGVETHTTGIIVTAITAIVIFGSLKAVSKASSGIVVVMSVLYILIGIAVLVVNYQNIIPAFESIFAGAFDLTSGVGALFGHAIAYGIKRGLFSNEAGMGSAPNIAATASTKHPAEQGLVQMIGVCFDTFIICTFSALIVLTTGLWDKNLYDNAALTSQSVVASLGSWSSIAMSIIIFLFAFSSIIGNFAYALSGLKYFTQNKFVRFSFTIAVCAVVYIGSVSSPTSVWNAADLAMAVMTLLNLVAIVFLWKQVKLIIDDYKRQLHKKAQNENYEIVFNSDLYPVLRDKLYHQSIWSRKLDEEADDGIHKTSGYKIFGTNDTENHR
ncbi:alanine/glycine:cation symporter family protein [Psittacicella gerlachiana]|uniref:AGCS family alanine or glycine:cation symporter n=1 Tax=Psittacicella gerlachiana TaxID=2028574 RepID=A0A3A1YMR1_9GAMM|nr:alanine/glycine:cation symporter family protein [Psittacicella gerlachiana]RIY38841.1 hypothetical protein CKF59_00125 [Psittacicella gerlachiana]